MPLKPPLPPLELTEESPVVIIPDWILTETYIESSIQNVVTHLRQCETSAQARADFMAYATHGFCPRLGNPEKHETWVAVHQRLFDRGYCEFLAGKLAK